MKVNTMSKRHVVPNIVGTSAFEIYIFTIRALMAIVHKRFASFSKSPGHNHEIIIIKNITIVNIPPNTGVEPTIGVIIPARHGFV